MDKIIGRNISILYRNEYHYVDNQLKEYNLNKVQAETLLYLKDNNGVNQTALNDYFLFNKATITKIITHLVEFDYVYRVVSENDRREKEIFLTENGSNMLPIIIEVLGGWERNAIANISSDDIDNLKNLLAQMVHNITSLKKEEHE